MDDHPTNGTDVLIKVVKNNGSDKNTVAKCYPCNSNQERFGQVSLPLKMHLLWGMCVPRSLAFKQTCVQDSTKPWNSVKLSRDKLKLKDKLDEETTWSQIETSNNTPCWKIPDPSSQKLSWAKPPLSVLVVRKLYDADITYPFKDLVVWLIEEKNMVVYADRAAVDCCMVDTDLDFIKIKQKLILFNEGQVNLTAKIDFVICLGGDGTLIHASSLFQQSVPPIMAFNMGSLGFLTPFQFCHFKEEINKCLGGNASLLLRYRLKCVINCDNITSGSLSQTKTQDSSSSSTPCDQKAANTYLVLNEIVVDRGSTPYLCNIDLYIEGRLVTSVQGDGLIISTPTGSTAYAVAAGASMIHPNVPCLLITPICPHSLSFRPVVVPAGVEIKLMLSPEARSSAWVSFDGRNRIEINQGESLRITTARYPIPSICAKDQMNDWFDGLAECLHWNVRKQQKSLPSMSSTTSLNSLISDSETNN
ncbi:hypothetical protein SNE40_013755 [Patella caerulea]|uniref:NAD(+) kinase n=2 Tax=Patella caerulea TaxID=87958 RepID=A0AAN8JD36_PATCE